MPRKFIEQFSKRFIGEKHTDNDRVGFRKYWFGIVFPRAKSEIWEYIKGHVAMALLIILAAVAASILSANGILDVAISTGYISDASNSIRTLVAVLFLSVLYLLWGVLYYPVLLYREQQKQIQELKDKWESSPVPLRLVITPLNNRSEEKKIGSIRIDNPTPNKIPNLKIELKDLIKNPFLSGEEPRSTLDEISYSNRSFNDIDRLNKDGGIDGLDYVIVHLAKIVDNGLVILLKNNLKNHWYWEFSEDKKEVEKIKKIQPEYTGWKSFNCRYDIELIIRGEFNDRPLEAQSFKARVEFREMIKHWVEINKQWIKTGDLADIYTRIDIYEVRDEEEQETKP